MKSRKLLLAIALTALALAGAAYWMRLRYPPIAWAELQHWARTAKPGELYRNPEFLHLPKKNIPSMHTQRGEMRFLFSDSPEYLYKDSLNKGLVTMRLSDDAQFRRQPTRRVPFGVGLYHINKVTDTAGKTIPVPVKIVVRALPFLLVDGKKIINSAPTTVRLLKGAYGLAHGQAVFAGKRCALNWFGKPNVKPTAITLQPGETSDIFSKTLADPDKSLSAMFDFEASNAFFLQVYTVFGEVKDYDKIVYAPFGLTIGTNSGWGPYWKRELVAKPGARAFDAADTRLSNKAIFRFEKQPEPPEMQFLIDDTWDQRQEGNGKDLVRSKGGQRRPFKGDYNVEYTIRIPVYSSTGRPARFAVVDIQRFGAFGGAVVTPDGLVSIPNGDETVVSLGPEGVLLARPTVTSKTPTEYTFKWMLTGGSYGDQAFMLVPLGEEK